MTVTAEAPARPVSPLREAALMIAVVVVSNVAGNLLMSRGLRGAELGGVGGHIRVLFNPWVAAGVTLLIVWMVSRLVFLRRADLSYVLPVTSVGYVLNAVLAQPFLGERVTWLRWAGTLLIVAGAVLAGRTEMRR